MTKNQMIAELADRTGVPREDVTIIVEAFLQCLQEHLLDGENVDLRGFGSFLAKYRARKMGRNIARNQPMVIEEHFTAIFKASKTFADAMRANTDRIRTRQGREPNPAENDY